MRTTVNLDDELLKDAKRLTGIDDSRNSSMQVSKRW